MFRRVEGWKVGPQADTKRNGAKDRNSVYFVFDSEGV